MTDYARDVRATERHLVGLQLTLQRLAEHMGVPPVTEEEISAVLDAERDLPGGWPIP